MVQCGSEAHAHLVRCILDLQGEDPLAPVTVITPTSRSAIALRRIVARHVARSTGRSGIGNVTFAVLRRFCEEISGAMLAGQGRRPLTRVVLEASCRSVLLAPGGPGGVLPRSLPSVIEIADRYEELRTADPSALGVLVRRGGTAGTLAACVAEVRARLAEGYYDDVDLYDTTTECVEQGLVTVPPTVVFGYERPTPSVLALLAALGAGSAVEIVEIAFGATITDAPVCHAVVHAPYPESEVAEATARIGAHLARGARPEALAVLYARREPYARLLAEAFGRAGIAWSGPGPDSLASSIGAGALRSVLEVAGSLAPARRDVLELVTAISTVPSDPLARPTGTFDRVTRRIGLGSGTLDEWVARIEHEFGLRAPSGEGGTSPSLPGGWRRDRSAASELVAVLRTIEPWLALLRGARSWAEFGAVLAGALDACVAPESVRVEWPGPYGESERLVVRVIDELSALDSIDPYPGLPTATVAFARACDRDGPQVGRLGAGVVVGTLEHGHAVALDAVVLLGCAEGDLPRRAPLSPLLGASDREIVGLDSRTPGTWVERDRRRFLLAVGGAVEVTACVPAFDPRSGRERIPSRFLLGAPVVRPGARLQGALSRGRSPLEDLDERVDPQTLLLAALVDRAGRDRFEEDPLVAGMPEVRAAWRRGAARAGEVCGVFDGAAPGAIGIDVVAPTTLERFAICPFRFFLDDVLRIETVEEPERRLVISPLDRGEVMHVILERYVRRWMAGDLPPDDPGRAAVFVAISEEVFARTERLGRSGKRVTWAIERRRILEHLERERRTAEVTWAAGRSPIAVEYAFGTPSAPGPVVEIGGRKIAFRGAVDRIDRTPSGAVEVVDYKSGNVRPYRRDRENPIGRGRHLQLPVYALAARAAFDADGVRAVYRFIGDDPTEIEFRLDPTGSAQFTRALGVLVGAIDAGAFPYRPGPANDRSCRTCDFDELCPSDRTERWERVRFEPRFTSYRELVEPSSDAERPLESEAEEPVRADREP